MNTITSKKPIILIADDDDDIRLALELLLTASDYQIVEASTPKETIIQVQRCNPDLILLDMNFSRDTTSGKEGLKILDDLEGSSIPIILMTAWGSIQLAVDGLKRGASDFIEKPWNKDKMLNSISQQLGFSRIRQEHKGYRQLLSSDQSRPQPNWICQSKAMKTLEGTIGQIAQTDANVLILGENGTGKSLLANRIHQQSSRADNPIITINMAAVPENLFESELFGHQKGAFTDAKHNRVGRFQLADQGSLFMDEIGSLPLNLQPKLLRVLETGEYEVLGSSQTQVARVRLISATNADLDQLVSEGIFRQDLLYRLNTLVITMPPLRDRVEDIEPLVESFNQLFSAKYQKAKPAFASSAIEKLRQHSWPGNIRELSHVVERAVLLCSENEIMEAHLMLEMKDSNSSTGNVEIRPLEQAERQLIKRTMDVTSGNIIEAAKLLDISRNALYRRLEKHNLDFNSE